MTVYDYKAQEAPEQPGYEWTDRKGNILKVPDDLWDPAIDNDKGCELVSYLNQEQYDGPGDWNPY